MVSFFVFLGSSLLFLFVLNYLKSKKLVTAHNHGPLSYPLIGCLISFYKNRHRLLDWYTEILSQSPSQTMVLKRLGAPRTIVTANPVNVEYILKTNFKNYPKGKPFTEILGDFLGLGIFNVDGELWNMERKFASHEFSAKSLNEFVVKTLEEEVEMRLLPVLETAAAHNKVLDLQEVLRGFAFNTICKVALGSEPCCLDLSRPVSPLAKAFDRASELCAKRGVAPIYAVWKFKKALSLGSERELKAAVKLVHEIVSGIIRAKKEKLKQNSSEITTCNDDLLTRFLMAGHEDDLVRDMIISFLMAGKDTTSAALTWFFWLISKHHGVRKQLQDELMSLKIGAKKLNLDDLKRMNYTRACLCESMRLYPPVAWDSKHAETEDILPDGTIVHKGNRVTYFQYGMGRMEELWGKDWSEFKPDRWFDHGSVRVLKMVNPYKFSVFQAGPRVCLGKEMAFIQMKYLVASILSRFKIEPVKLGRPIFVPLLTAHMAGGFNVRILRKGVEFLA